MTAKAKFEGESGKPVGEIPAVELKSLVKKFGAVQANAGVDLRVESGTIHGIIGENGAGKSTAMKMLYGMFRPDSGEIHVHGRRSVWASPREAIKAGIGMVHQHFMLSESHTALDNVLIGAEPIRYGFIDRGLARRRFEELTRSYGLALDWSAKVADLPVALQQRLEILKLLYREAQILILDEPTAVLTPQEIETLFGNLRKLRKSGKTVLLITHKLREVMAVTDRVTVFRNGRVVAETLTSETNAETLAQLMIGRKISLQVEATAAKPSKEDALAVRELSLKHSKSGRVTLSQVTFLVKRGEIVGIAGVEGNGQSELLQALLHPSEPRSRSSGTVWMLGKDVTSWSTRQIRELGVALIPEDRLKEGLMEEGSLCENILLGLQRESIFNSFGFIRRKKLREAAQKAVDDYQIRPIDIRTTAGRLSGGNQQKLIVAREFSKTPRVLLAAQPARGVDVGAKEFIHRQIIRARDEGAGVLLISSELEEIIGLSNRILVMYEGRITAEFQHGSVGEKELGLAMGGHNR